MSDVFNFLIRDITSLVSTGRLAGIDDLIATLGLQSNFMLACHVDKINQAIGSAAATKAADRTIPEDRWPTTDFRVLRLKF